MSCGRNSGVVTFGLTFSGELEAGQQPVEPGVGVEPGTLLRERPCIFVEGYDMDIEVETARPDELEQPLERGLDLPALDPGHQGLGYPRPRCKSALRDPGPTPGFTNELTPIHLPMIHVPHRTDV